MFWIVRALLIIALSISIGSAIGWGLGTIRLRKIPEYWSGEIISEDVVPRVGLTMLGDGFGFVVGSILVVAVASTTGVSPGYDLTLDPVKPEGVDSNQVVAYCLALILGVPGSSSSLVHLY